MGCDIWYAEFFIGCGYFNPRTHVGCDAEPTLTLSPGINFNPRTHVGCDNLVFGMAKLPSISIHAPTWGATQTQCENDEIAKISIHAPTWGATLVLSLFVRGTGFQSTHPRGVRQLAYRLERVALRFQSTHPRGVRPGLSTDLAAAVEFQSTHPRGVRR